MRVRFILNPKCDSSHLYRTYKLNTGIVPIIFNTGIIPMNLIPVPTIFNVGTVPIIFNTGTVPIPFNTGTVSIIFNTGPVSKIYALSRTASPWTRPAWWSRGPCRSSWRMRGPPWPAAWWLGCRLIRRWQASWAPSPASQSSSRRRASSGTSGTACTGPSSRWIGELIS